MCLIVFALECHRKYSLVLAANRDEYFDRPTIPASYWTENPSILAGRDMITGGTWLGVTKEGRLAAITNYRDPEWQVENPIPRGTIVADYLTGDLPAAEFLDYIKERGSRYKGFNIVFGDPYGIFYYSNRSNTENIVMPGVYGLSNHLLDTPWPKVTSAKERFESLIRSDTEDPEEYIAVLADRTRFPDYMLPDTGVGIKRERSLSSIFVTSRIYGTRSTTLFFIDRENRLRFIERSHDPECSGNSTTEFRITLQPS
jgi:uncharacterized protein with NRDE domain